MMGRLVLVHGSVTNGATTLADGGGTAVQSFNATLAEFLEPAD